MIFQCACNTADFDLDNIHAINDGAKRAATSYHATQNAYTVVV